MARPSRGYVPESNGPRNANTFSVALSDEQANKLEAISLEAKRRIPDVLRDLIDSAPDPRPNGENKAAPAKA